VFGICAFVVLAAGIMTLPSRLLVKLDVLHHLLDRIVRMIDPSLAGSSEPETFTVEAKLIQWLVYRTNGTTFAKYTIV
jgi:hypothetical protein